MLRVTGTGTFLVSIGVGQRIARNGLAAKPHVVQTRRLGAQVDFDIAQRFAPRQLREGHGKELIPTRKILDLVIAPVRCDTAAKSAQR